MTVTEKKNCECEVCIRHRAFEYNLTLIENQNVKEYLEGLYDYFMNVEEDADCNKVYLKNLQRLYPKIYKEVCTLQPLKIDEAGFPEKQI